jgi:thioredoxin reductase
MKKSNLILGLLGGAAAGAAAVYLMNAEARKGVMDGLTSLGETAISPITNLLGSDDEEGASTGRSQYSSRKTSSGSKNTRG